MVVRRRLSVLWAAAIMLLTVLVCSGMGWAVTYGVPDGDNHPYVGLVALIDDKEEFVGRCSGTLLSPTVVLTAGHCTDVATRAQVWFDSTVNPAEGGVMGTPYTHLDFESGNLQNDDKDVGVVVLDDPVQMDTYGQLPELGELDKLATQRGTQEQTFTIVGYGLQSVRPTLQEDLVRYKGTVSLIDLRSAISDGHTIQITKNPGQRSSGGQCPGDSGGPYLYEGTDTVVGIASFSLNANCKGTSFAYRTDIATTQDFVRPFLD
jgi:secreted trypsin-like serine protease